MKTIAALSAALLVMGTQYVIGQTRPLPKRPVALSKAADNQWLATSATRSVKDVALYRAASPSVVLILTDDGLGSGALIDASGLILTNKHVVGDATQVLVVFKPSRESAEPVDADIRVGEVVKIDAIADLALIKVPTVPVGHGALRLGDAAAVVIGSDVHAIGHPTGAAWTYTTGIISQLRPSYEWGYDDEPFLHKADIVQTQTPISPGSSGGPLINDAGAMVGVNTFLNGGAQNLNFAVGLRDITAFIVRVGNRPGVPRPAPSPSASSSNSANLADAVDITDVSAPYPSVSPATFRLTLVNSSALVVREVHIGSVDGATPNGRCPSDEAGYRIVRGFEGQLAPGGTSVVTGDFTATAKFFCVVRASTNAPASQPPPPRSDTAQLSVTVVRNGSFWVVTNESGREWQSCSLRFGASRAIFGPLAQRGIAIVQVKEFSPPVGRTYFSGLSVAEVACLGGRVTVTVR